MTFPDGPEIELPAGDVTVGVVRIGDTVRRPASDRSEFVAGYLAHLEAVGLEGVPRYLGRDAAGRDVLTFLDGDVPADPVPTWAASDGVLPGVARLLRRLHDASEGYEAAAPPREPGRPAPVLPEGERRLIAHRDVTPQNTVFRDGLAWGLVDFDLSDWTTRSIDLANTAMHWVPLAAPADRAPVYEGAPIGRRLRLMLDAYGRDAVGADALIHACELRFEAGYETMRWAAEHLGGGWARMWDEGVGEVIRRRVAWFAEAADGLRAELG